MALKTLLIFAVWLLSTFLFVSRSRGMEKPMRTFWLVTLICFFAPMLFISFITLITPGAESLGYLGLVLALSPIMSISGFVLLIGIVLLVIRLLLAKLGLKGSKFSLSNFILLAIMSFFIFFYITELLSCFSGGGRWVEDKQIVGVRWVSAGKMECFPRAAGSIFEFFRGLNPFK